MSRLKALPADPDAAAVSIPVITDPSVRGPRGAAEVDAPITSPVHAMHEQLLRFGETGSGDETSFPFAEDKAPGWVRMGLPVGLSVVLWVVILRVTGLLG